MNGCRTSKLARRLRALAIVGVLSCTGSEPDCPCGSVWPRLIVKLARESGADTTPATLTIVMSDGYSHTTAEGDCRSLRREIPCSAVFYLGPDQRTGTLTVNVSGHEPAMTALSLPPHNYCGLGTQYLEIVVPTSGVLRIPSPREINSCTFTGQ
jgi:hypothetical protein